MAKKGHPKNTKNKALHSKLMSRKKSKQREEKVKRALRLKELTRKINEMRKGKKDKDVDTDVDR